MFIFHDYLRDKQFVEYAIVAQIIFSYFYVVYLGMIGSISPGAFSIYLSAISTFSTTIGRIISIIINSSNYTKYYKDYNKYIFMLKGEDELTKKSISTFEQIDFIKW